MPSPLKERVGRCCFCSYLVRLVFFPLDGYGRSFFLLGFSFCFSTSVLFRPRRVKFFLSFCFWPGEVSSVASSGPFLDLAFVQVILGIVVILLIERSPCFCHGLTFPFSSPQILSNRLQVAVVYYTSWICALLQRKT